MTEQLAIIGAGGHGRVVADAALAGDRWRSVKFFDDQKPVGESVGPWHVAGSVEFLVQRIKDYPNCIVAIGENRTRLSICERLRKMDTTLVSVIHPNACVSDFAIIKEGCAVSAGAIVNIGTVLGTGCIVNTGASIDHDCLIGSGVHVSPQAALAGGVIVGELTWIGISTCIREGVVIGSNVTVGAGSTVLQDIKSHITVAGTPAHEI